MEYDVIVIGAGMAGILTAYYLQEEEKKVLVLEEDEIASGQTGRTTAKITSQHGLKYIDLAKKVGVEKARLYAKANEQAICDYEKLIQREGIPCHFERLSSYLYTRNMERIEDLKREADIASVFDIPAVFVRKTELPFEVKGAVCFQNQAQFDADAFVTHLASKLEIREHTKVINFHKNQVITNKGVFTGKNIVVATHYPFRNVPGFYFLRQHQERSYVLALSGCSQIQGMYYGIDQDGYSFRQKGDILLFGGEGRRTGEHTCNDSYRKLMEKAEQFFLKATIEDMWSAQDCMPHDGIPFIGKYSIFLPHVYVATGFGKWGMTSSMVAAHILRDMICGRPNPYIEVFTPQRLLIRAGWRNFVKDVGVSVKGLWGGWFKKEEPRCTHLGCGLHFNEKEETWECPCHGSRFDKDGKMLDHPAKYDQNLGK